MKNVISFFLSVLIFLVLGCSTSKNTVINRSQDFEDTIVHYHVKTKSIENDKYAILIENQFRELENLELPFVKIHYNKKNIVKFDCEIDIIFDDLTINDKEYSNNKHFSKVVREEQPQDENDTGPNIASETIRGYVYQSIKERKLNWNIIIKTNSNSDNCKFIISSFTERSISKSVNNTLSGDERAISKKYKEPIGQALLSKREMAEETINNVYKKIVYQLKKKS